MKDVATQSTEDRTAPLRAAEGGTLAEAAYAALRADIISGALPGGARLRIERLSARYGVGPTPLREALQRLCAVGLALAQGNRGFAVAPLRIEEFHDLTTARIAVEKEALRLSLARGGEDWQADVAAAAWRLARRDAALKTGDATAFEAWEAANAAFHAATVAACGSTWLLRVRAQLSEQGERYRRASVALPNAHRDLAAEHAAIAAAVLERDVEGVCALIERHFGETARLLEAEMAGA